LATLHASVITPGLVYPGAGIFSVLMKKGLKRIDLFGGAGGFLLGA